MELPRTLYERGPGSISLGNESNLFSILDIRDILFRRWRLIFAVTVFAIVIGAIYVVISPARYTATTSMIIDIKKTTFTQSELALENRMVDDATVESEIETIKSERVAIAVIGRLNLTKDAEFVGTGREFARHFFALFTSHLPTESLLPNEQLMRNTLSSFKSGVKVARLGRRGG